MEPEDRVDLDLTRLGGNESGLRDCVIVRGFNPGVKTHFEAIVDTYLLSGSVAFRFSSEASALRHWKRVLSAGNEVCWLGSGSIEERLAYRDILCQRLTESGSVLVFTPTARTRARERPVRRTDSISVPSSLSSPPPSPRSSPSPAPISVTITPHQPGESHDAGAASSVPVSYAPPPTAGVDYRPRNLPADYVCRGKRSQHPWYCSWKNRCPGIYSDWDHVVAAHGDCPRARVTEGHSTYRQALAQWVTLRDANEIRRWA
ncbi:hypothetical protein PENSPDRAFT_690810 [Peniophora sp. CONT]|nr:hypothetical protein PENSPDRAFT_690810 [Peniophora sp. CONT]